MTQVMQPNVVEPGSTANRLPWRLQIRQCSASFLTDNDMRVAVKARQIGKDGEGRGWQVQGFRARLAVGEPSLAPLEINPFPSKPEHFPEARAGKHQQLHCGDGIRRTLKGRQRIAQSR